MKRPLLLLLLATALNFGSARAGTIWYSTTQGPAIDAITSDQTYAPGAGAAEFYIRLSDISDLYGYTIALSLTGSSGVFGTDFGFTDYPPVGDLSKLDFGVPLSPANSYVFGPVPGYVFTGSALIDDPSQSLTLFDVADLVDNTINIDAVAGTNDLIAKVTLWTTPQYLGLLTVNFDLVDLTDGISQDPIPVEAFQGVDSFNLRANVIPEPSTLALGLLGAGSLLVVGGRRALKRS